MPAAVHLAREILHHGGKDPIFPDDDNLMLLKWMQADGVPEVVQCLQRCDTADREDFLLQYLKPLGRMAQPAVDTLLAMASDDQDPLRSQALDVLVLSGDQSAATIEQLKDALRISGELTPEDEKRVIHVLQLLAKEPREFLRRELIDLADRQTSLRIQYAALQGLISLDGGKSDAVSRLLTKKLSDEFAYTDGFDTNSCASLAVSELARRRNVSSDCVETMISRLYKMSFEPGTCDAFLLAEAICNSSGFNEDGQLLIQHRLISLMDEKTWVYGSETETLYTRLAAAMVILKSNPHCKDANEFLGRVLRGEVLAKSGHSHGTLRQIDWQSRVARVVQRLETIDSRLELLLQEVFAEQDALEPNSRVAFQIALAIAAINRTDTKCVAVSRARRSIGGLPLQHLTLEEYAYILGDRLVHVLDAQEISRKTATELAFVEHAEDVAFWRLAQPHTQIFLPILREHILSANSEVRLSVLTAIQQFSLPTTEVVQLVVEAANDQSPGVRAVAAAAIGKFSKHADIVIPKLKALTHDKTLTVQIAAANALRELADDLKQNNSTSP